MFIDRPDLAAASLTLSTNPAYFFPGRIVMFSIIKQVKVFYFIFVKIFSMLQSPYNNLLLSIKDVFVKQYGAVAKTSAMYAQSSDINAADMVNIVGQIEALPRQITEEGAFGKYKGYSTKDMQVGDTAIFRYDVVYDFAKDGQRFKNMFWYRGREYWSADIQKIFAVIRRGEIIMVNGYCMVESCNNPVNIILPYNMKNIDGIGSATLTHIGNNLTHLPNIEAVLGDTVFYDPRKLQKYEIGKKKFGILKSSQIFGVKRPQSANILP